MFGHILQHFNADGLKGGGDEGLALRPDLLHTRQRGEEALSVINLKRRHVKGIHFRWYELIARQESSHRLCAPLHANALLPQLLRARHKLCRPGLRRLQSLAHPGAASVKG